MSSRHRKTHPTRSRAGLRRPCTAEPPAASAALDYGRLRPGDAGRFVVAGDRDLLTSWLDATAL
ncbi:hypothetical protein [Nonomuraea sp. NPDC050786]|uniref:hypothetical protein n=1 Tax=Nonomuraea sp. NPDC050786 TaxID=3154840 RepID=UPI0034062528